MLEKSFDPASAEPRIYKAWEDAGAFRPSDAPGAEPYTIVIPPPNVTGSLHMGHALNNTLQDILCRFERMRGKSVLWQPGTDHAGIATQMVVERQLADGGGDDRRSMGRDAFIRRIWEWRRESGGQIINQLKRLGASCDWSRERFTMGADGSPDDQMVQAVMKVFVALHEEGLIYRDKRLVNWDPKFETAISDLEVENKEVDGHFWHFKYPLENGETYQFPIAFDEAGEATAWETRDFISIATTRPETMLGDGAVAVHPSDKRYAPIVGKRCLLPLADRYIPIIADDYPDPDFGSGAVKITGAHDFNDYQVAKRNDIAMYVLFDAKARMIDEDHIPEKYRQMDRFQARSAIVDDIDARGLLIKVEDKKIMQPFGDRSGVVIEPMLTDQWYVNAEELAKGAIQAVEEGETRFIPENWSKTYFQWMRNIEPWCISRQLWWGHRIPAWYGPDGAIFVAETEGEARRQAGAHYGEQDVLLEQDPDVLDTWFSSALWPFSTLGWPDDTPALAAHYPTSILVTAFDIIFFWVARMMMMGIHFQKKIPFPAVLIHGLVVDENGQKMSKSKGNGVDPLDIIDKYGADALRFSLAAQAAQGRNVRISDQRVEGYRNFGTKLWNAARFCEMNECALSPAFSPSCVELPINQWIIHEANNCAAEVERSLEAYRFNEASSAVYRFSWNVFCDWYLELAKPVLQGEDEFAKGETRNAAAWALAAILKMLQPFMPFLSQEIWSSLKLGQGQLMTSSWPTSRPELSNADAAADLTWLIDVITAIRSVRAEMNVPAGAKTPLCVIAPSTDVADRIARYQTALERLARIDVMSSADATPKGAIQTVVDGVTFALPIADIIDVEAERARLGKEVAKIDSEIGKIDKKLANDNFIAKAPPAVVEEQKKRRSDYAVERDKLSVALNRLAEL